MSELPLRKVGDFIFGIDRDVNRGMNSGALIFASEDLVQKAMSDGSIEQLVNVTKLPGIVGPAIAMPDIHLGYGFPIGGVAAFSYDDGLVSPGGVGYDINCGVSLLSIPITQSTFASKRKEVIDALFQRIPSGVGTKGKLDLSRQQLASVMTEGINWVIENGMGDAMDVDHTDELGKFGEAEVSKVSPAATGRGMKQLGTLGAGNHFVEIQRVSRVFDSKIASAFNLSENNITAMVHTGSRGLGHQVATDYIEKLLRSGSNQLPDRQLVFARNGERLFDDYIGAMQAAANFAFSNREIIIDQIRRVFAKAFNLEYEDMRIVYSISHNLARVEEHEVEGKKTRLIVHRKGATRAFPPGRKENGSLFKLTGHPVLVPGSMGSDSYVLVGEKKNMELTFGSSCHGAGRVISRHKAMETLNLSRVSEELNEKGVYLKTASRKVIQEEAPGSYKQIEQVIRSIEGAGISRSVVSLSPLGVIKG